MSDDMLLDDDALDLLLGRWQAPPPRDALVARVVAEAVRADRPRLPTAVRGRGRWTRRGVWTGIVAFNLVLASAVAAAFGGGALNLGRLRVAADRVIAHVLPRRAVAHHAVRHGTTGSRPPATRPMAHIAPVMRPMPFLPHAGAPRMAAARPVHPMPMAAHRPRQGTHRIARSPSGPRDRAGRSHRSERRGLAHGHDGRRDGAFHGARVHPRADRAFAPRASPALPRRQAGAPEPDRPGDRGIDRRGWRQADDRPTQWRRDGWREGGWRDRDWRGGGWNGGWRQGDPGGWRRNGWRGGGAGRGWRGRR